MSSPFRPRQARTTPNPLTSSRRGIHPLRGFRGGEGGVGRERTRLSLATRFHLDVLLVGLAILVAAWTEIRSLDSRSLWIDEVLSRTYASQSLGGLFSFFVHGELNMALYHLFLHYWLRLGDGEAALRSLSVVFALMTLPFAYVLGKRLVSARVGVLATVLLALNGAFYSFAREARSYSLTILLVTAASYFFIRALDSGRASDWSFYVVTAVLAVYAHLFAMTVVLAHFLSLGLRRGRPVDKTSASIAAVAAVALLSPAVLYVVTGDRSLTTDPDTNLRDVPDLFRWYASGNRPLLLLFLFGAVIAVVAAARRRVRFGSDSVWPESFLIVWLAVPILAALAVSYTIDPIFEFRYLLVVLPAFILLVAVGIARASAPVLFAVLTLAVLGASVRTLDLCQPGCSTPTQDFRGATHFIRLHAKPRDEIFFDPAYLSYAFAYYAPRTEISHWSAHSGLPQVGRDRPSSAAQRVWVLADMGDPNSAAYRDSGLSFGKPWRLVDTHRFTSLIVSRLYVRAR
jgi:mannosyltransferase